MQAEAVFKTIRENIREYYSDPVGNPEQELANLQADGSFCDLDYSNQNWTQWPPNIHLQRVVRLCRMYATLQNPFYHSTLLKENICAMIRFFLNGNFHSDNWWMNDVGVPTKCGMIRILFQEELGEEENARLLQLAMGNPAKPRIFSYCKQDAFALRPYQMVCGAVFTQILDTHIYLAAENQDPQKAMRLIDDCIRAICHELTVITYPAGKSPGHTYGEEHCIKSDYSYQAHENCLLPGTYGYMVIDTLATLFRFWKGTDLQLDAEASRQLANLILDGYAYISYRGAHVMTTLGRNAGSADNPSYYRPETMENLALLCDVLLERQDTARREELRAARERFLHPETAAHFTGTRFYWHSDFLSHNRPDWQFTVHGVSERLKRPESCLKKNLLGMYLGDGCYTLQTKGGEYEGLAPCMDWTRLPGVTANVCAENLNPESEIDTEADPLRLFGGAHGTTAFVGGVSDGAIGCFAMDYNHLGVKAKKSWFCFADSVVCLGAGISAEPGAHAFTALNQCVLDGAVFADGVCIPEGERQLPQCEYVYSGGVGYVFLEKSEGVFLSNRERSGCWSRVDRDSGSDSEVKKKIFLLGIDHGGGVQNGSYAYQLLPNITEMGIAVAENKNVCVLENTAAVQGVQHRETGDVMAVLYRAGKLVAGDIQIEADDGCVFMLRRRAEGWRLYLSDPLHEAKTVCVRLSGAIDKTIFFALEEGFRKNNLGRPLCYDSALGFLPYSGAMGDE